jgi:hypothetical protein
VKVKICVNRGMTLLLMMRTSRSRCSDDEIITLARDESRLVHNELMFASCIVCQQEMFCDLTLIVLDGSAIFSCREVP